MSAPGLSSGSASNSASKNALNVEPNLDDADAFYAALIDVHRGLSDVQSTALNARLILLLANHIGAAPVLRDALEKARQSVDEELPS